MVALPPYMGAFQRLRRPMMYPSLFFLPNNVMFMARCWDTVVHLQFMYFHFLYFMSHCLAFMSILPLSKSKSRQVFGPSNAVFLF